MNVESGSKCLCQEGLSEDTAEVRWKRQTLDLRGDAKDLGQVFLADDDSSSWPDDLPILGLIISILLLSTVMRTVGERTR